MSTLLFERSLPRFAAARLASSFGSGRGAGVGPLRLVDHVAPALPGEGWVHVDPVLSGICGSDLSTLDGRSSRFFEEIVSFPFVPGHEVVGRLSADAVGADNEPLAAGSRVVLHELTPLAGSLEDAYLALTEDDVEYHAGTFADETAPMEPVQ